MKRIIFCTALLLNVTACVVDDGYYDGRRQSFGRYNDYPSGWEVSHRDYYVRDAYYGNFMNGHHNDGHGSDRHDNDHHDNGHHDHDDHDHH